MDTPTLTEQTIKKILLARHLYALAEDNIKSGNPVRLTAGVILLQDSVEVFLLALAEHLDVSLDAKMEFDKYFVAINKKIEPKELPLKIKMNTLNRLRVTAKHNAIQPVAEECTHALASVSDFFDEVSTEHMGQPLGGINLTGLLEEGEPKRYFKEAVAAYAKGDFKGCLVNCGKAIYSEFLFWYSVEAFKAPPPSSMPLNTLSMLYSLSPSYAQNQEYINEKVKNPLDYIVIDHQGFDMELMKYGIGHNEFFNILRLTPEVYSSANGVWFVKEEFIKLADEIVKSSAEYVLDSAVDIVLRKQRVLRAVKQPPNDSAYVINLKSDDVKIYKKADKNSEFEVAVPAGRLLSCDFHVPGLSNDAVYYHVTHIDRDLNLFFSGYVHQDDVLFD